MPIIAAQVTTLKTPKMMQDNLRIHLRNAEIPEYSWKQQRAGFEVWHGENNEGETIILWRSFAEGDNELTEMRAGLELCAESLLEHFWVQLYVPNRLSLKYGRMHLRVLHGLHWLS